MANSTVRVRFAPSPTGLMHIGNIRTALMNFLFAKKKNGTFIVRIEDTDPERNFDPGAQKIIADLEWLGLTFTEGPHVNGPYAPYFQSQRMAIYQEKLNDLIAKKLVYPCFCTQEELDKKRERQIALKRPPRYDGTCLKRSVEEVEKLFDNKTPFIWRMYLNQETTIIINDITHGDIKFELKNFSDFPLTRQNGTFTFMFANFVDDMVMEISHVLRGEDHLTNTAGQAALYQAFGKKLPIFWHLPVICNKTGKKLSKRDFGFSLNDLREAGFLPEALCNYLAITGGGSFKQEIMSLEELAKTMNFDQAHSSGRVKYDIDKLTWINHKWIDRYDPEKLADVCLPYLEKTFDQVKNLDKKQITTLIQTIKTDFEKLPQVVDALRFYFERPTVTLEMIENQLGNDVTEQIKTIIQNNITSINTTDEFIKSIKIESKQQEISLKQTFSFLRLCLMNSINGPSIHDLFEMLGNQEATERIKTVL